MNKSISLVAVVLMAAGVYAKEAERIRSALAVTGTAEVVAVQSFGGSNVVSAVLQAGYDADVCCDLAVAHTNGWLAVMSVKDASPEKQRATALAIIRQTKSLHMAAALLFNEKTAALMSDADWESIQDVKFDVARQPPGLIACVYGTPQSIRQRKSLGWHDLDAAVLVTALLDGEAKKNMAQMNAVKEAIKDRCAAGVKGLLRKEGKTFVARTVVTTNAAGNVMSALSNPIEARLRPVVDALNAPECEGLEAALRSFGFEVRDMDRTKLRTDVRKYADSIMNGETPANPANDGSIAVLLGPDGYNAWVKAYNEGK